MRPSEELKVWVQKSVKKMEPGTFLPSDKDLANRFEISPRTVSSLMALLASKGVVERIQGKGTRKPIFENPGKIPRIPGKQSSDQSLFEAFRRQISRGDLRSGDPLPTSKAVCLQYHVSARTVRKVYEQLCLHGFAGKAGRNYWVGDPGIKRTASGVRIVYMVYCHFDGIEQLSNRPFYAEMFTGIESVLQSNDLKVKYCNISDLEPEAVHWHRTNSYPHGILLMAFGIGPDDTSILQRLVERYFKWNPTLMSRIVTVGREPPPGYKISACLFGSMSTALSRTLARFLYAKGLMRIVFHFNPKGISIREFTRFLRIYSEMLHLSPTTEMRFVILSNGGISDRESFFHEFEKNLHKDSLSGSLQRYKPIPMEEVVRKTEVVENFNTSFKRERTTWVFSKSQDAVEAKAWCSNHHIKIPGSVSIISLENPVTNVGKNITSCVMDVSALCYRLAHSLIGDILPPKTSRNYIRVPFNVLQRKTTP